MNNDLNKTNGFFDYSGLSYLVANQDKFSTKSIFNPDSLRRKLPAAVISGNWTNTIGGEINEEDLGSFGLINFPVINSDDSNNFDQYQFLINSKKGDNGVNLGPQIRMRHISSDSFDFRWRDLTSEFSGFDLKYDNKGNPYLVPKQTYNENGELVDVGIVSNTFLSAGGIGGEGGSGGGSYTIKSYNFLGDSWFNDESNHSNNTVLFNAGAVNDIWLKSSANEKTIGEQSKKIKEIEEKISGINTGIQKQVDENTKNIKIHETRIGNIESKLYWDLKFIKDAQGNKKYYLIPRVDIKTKEGEAEVNVGKLGIVSDTFIMAGGIGESGSGSGTSILHEWSDYESNPNLYSTWALGADLGYSIYKTSNQNKNDIIDIKKQIGNISSDLVDKVKNHETRISANETAISDHEGRITNNSTEIANIKSQLYWDIKFVEDSQKNKKYYLIPKSNAKIKIGEQEVSVGELGIVSNTFISAGGIGEGSSGGTSGLTIKGINDLDRANLNDDRTTIFNTGAVNKVYDIALTNKSDIQSQKELIQSNSQEITNIKNQIGNLDSGLSEKVKANEEAIAKHESRLDSIEPQLYWEEGIDDNGNPYLIPKKKTITTEGTEEVKEVGIVSNTFISAGGIGEDGGGGPGASTLGQLVNVEDQVDELNTNEQVINVLVQEPNVTHWSKAPLTYTHTQTTESSSWDIIHNMNRHPAVTVYDSAGTSYMVDVKYVDNNRLIINFSVPFSGYAELR